VTLTLHNVLYYRADTQILYVASGCGHAAAKAGCTPVGLYGLANRLPDILVMIFVGSIGAATLPAFNRVVAESRDSLRRLARSSITLMLAFAVPVAIFGSVFAPEALHVLGGRKFMEAAPALAVLVWTFPFFLVEGVMFNSLYALHRQRVVTLAFGSTLVFNVVANILLVPRFSYMACSALTVASEALNLVVVFVALRGSIGSLQLGGAVARVALIGAATAAVSVLLHPLTIFVALPAGVLVALGGVRLSRVLGPTEHDVLGRLPLLGRFARWV
jgi:O-antigen/teichoic acid export membrane protein